MKISVPSSYPAESPRVGTQGREIQPAQVPQSPAIPPGCPENTLEALPASPPIPNLPSAWWQSFLYGNPDALLVGDDARRAFALISNKLGKEIGQPDIGGSIRSSELRKKLYARFGADLALHTMQVLWLEAASNGEQASAPVVANMSEPVAKFFEHEDPAPFHRRESNEERGERELRSSLGGWPGG